MTLWLQLLFKRDCGDDNLCHSDLVVNMGMVYPNGKDYLLLGTHGAVRLQIKVLNSGEAAYLSNVVISYSDNVDFLKDPRSQYQCEAVMGEFIEAHNRSSSHKNTKQIVCHTKNPVNANEEIELVVVFDVRRLTSMSSPVQFSAYARTASDDTNMANNFRKYRMNVKYQAVTELSG